MAGKVSKKLKRKCSTPAEALGAVMTELRLKEMRSYQDVADEVGCGHGYMNDMEHGKRNPTLKVLQAIADAHKIRLSRLIARAEQKHERCQGEKKGGKPKVSE